MRFYHAACLALALALALGGGASATSLVQFSEEALAQGANRIVRGQVLASQTAFRAGAIPVFTHVPVRVTEVLAGPVEPELVHLSLPGGELDELRVEVPGTPTFAPGDEVLLFLTELDTGETTLLGFTQGRYQLRRDPGSGAWMAHRDLSGVHLVAPAGQALEPVAVGPEPWDALRQRLLRLRGAP